MDESRKTPPRRRERFLQVRVTERMVNELDTLAVRFDQSRSDLVREVLRRFIKEELR